MGGKPQKTSSAPWEGVAPFIRRTAKVGFNEFGDGGLAPQIAQLSGATRDARDGTAGLARNNGVTADAVGQLGSLMGQTPYAGMDQVRQNIASEVLPQVAGMFGQGGFANSTMAQQTAADAMTNALAPYEYDQFNRGVDNQFRALSLAPQVNAMQYGDLAALGGVGAERDARKTAFANQDRDNIFAAAQLFGGMGGLGRTQTSPGPGVLETVGGVGQTAANVGLAFSLLCDRRLKENIQRVGEVNGTPLHTFRYFFDEDDVRRIGPMADEVPPHMRGEINGIQVVQL